jgi:hypothetical protein
MAFYQDKIFCGIKQTKGSAVAVSHNYGQSWKLTNLNYPRIFSFFTLNQKLYVVTEVKTNAKNPVFETISDTNFYQRRDITSATLFPGIPLHQEYGNKLIKPLNIGNKLVYIGAYAHNDHQSKPFGVYIMHSAEKNKVSVNPIPLSQDEVPWDLKKDKETIYLLTGKKEKTNYKISVYQLSKDLKHFHELFHFYAGAFARSFEILNNDFYFGLGCEIENSKKWSQDELNELTGQLLRIKGAALF